MKIVKWKYMENESGIKSKWEKRESQKQHSPLFLFLKGFEFYEFSYFIHCKKYQDINLVMTIGNPHAGTILSELQWVISGYMNIKNLVQFIQVI